MRRAYAPAPAPAPALAALMMLASTTAWSVCNSISATPLVFGNYVGTQLDMTSTVTSTCSSGYAYYLCLNAGGGGNASARKMTAGGAARLNYQMFREAAHTSNWGDNNTVSCKRLTGTGSAQTFTVYGRIPAGQNIALGNYTDNPIAYQYQAFQTPMTVRATVAPGCTISAGTLAFAAYTGVYVEATSDLSLNCPGGITYTVGLGQGSGSGATVTSRKMTSGANTLSYSLFQNWQRTTNWGNTPGTDTVAGTGTGVAQALTVYGQISGGQFVTPGSYADTVVVTLIY